MSGLLLGLGATGIWTVLLALSDCAPGRGPWPPRRGNILTALWAWGLTILIYLGMVRLWGQPPALPGLLRFGIGLPLAVGGSLLQSAAMAQLGLAATSGWDRGLVTTGLYRVCRHPQYLGQILSIAGLALLIAAPAALLLGLAASAMLLYGSRIEDRALAARHPRGHAPYRAATPFLVPVQSRS